MTKPIWSHSFRLKYEYKVNMKRKRKKISTHAKKKWGRKEEMTNAKIVQQSERRKKIVQKSNQRHLNVHMKCVAAS